MSLNGPGIRTGREIGSNVKEDKMNRMIIAIGVAILVFAVGAPSQTPAEARTGTAEQELLSLMQDWMNAEVKADMAFLERFITEDCVITDPVGAVWTKAQFLAGLESGEGAVISFALDNMKARIYGEAAVVNGRMTARQTFKGQDISGQYQCTDVFIKKEGRWQCVAIHLSLISQK
jgi:ketosteroid isomerase-like protein